MTIKTKSNKKKKPIIFHPLLIGLYPVLALLAYNIIQLDPIYAVRAIVVTLLLSVFVFALALLITRDRYKGGLLASLFLILFLTYGHVYNIFENKSILGHHRFLITIWLIILGFGIWGIVRMKKKPLMLTSFLNIFSVILIAIPLFQIFQFELQHTKATVVSNPSVDKVWQPTTKAAAGSPDVYFIVLDAYARSDMLNKYNGYDNSQFLQQLQDLGFYVVNCSKSNYSFTAASISTTLNMDYLENFAGDYIKKNRNYYDLGELIKHNKVRELFSTLGYRFVSFDTDTWWLDITDSDQYISQYSSPWQELLDFNQLGNFESYYLKTTAFRIVDEYTTAEQNRLGKVLLSNEKAHYDQIMFDFNQLTQLPQSQSPKFVYMHMVAPHYPFVLAPDGSYQYTVPNFPGYKDQVEYIDQRLLEILPKIIKESKNPPVILIEGDHGLDTAVRNANLMAFYMPNGGEKNLYPTMTPVNSFRMVFNQYFGANYPLLPDISRWSLYGAPFDFKEVNYPCPAQ
jgi:hypothetical protein